MTESLTFETKLDADSRFLARVQKVIHRQCKFDLGCDLKLKKGGVFKILFSNLLLILRQSGPRTKQVELSILLR